MSETWSCSGGTWFGIFGDHAAVLLPPSEKARVAAVWDLVDDGAGFDETLDALISSGLRDLPGFVLVSRDGDETRVVLRGAARARFDLDDPGSEVVHVEGEQATTWVERTLHGVTRARIEVDDTPDGAELMVAHGLLRVAAAEWPGSRTDPDPEADPDHDGQTAAGTPTPERALPGIPGQPPAPPVTRPVARLELSTGETIDVDRVVVVGRAPESRGAGESVRLVKVASPQQEISATHLEIRPGSGADHGAAVVTDLGSTNGSLLVQPGLPPEDLKPGVSVQLVPGAVVDLGDGVEIRVVTP